jgi:hypothetical protein
MEFKYMKKKVKTQEEVEDKADSSDQDIKGRDGKIKRGGDKIERSKNTPSQTKRFLLDFKNWKLVDSILFIIIVIAVSLMMIVTGLAEVADDDKPEFENSDEFAKQISNVLLAGTVPRVNYTDMGGRETVYVGSSVKQLLIEDLRIRNNLGPYKAPANEKSLQNSLEPAVSSILSGLLGPSNSFAVNVTWQNEDGSTRPGYLNLKSPKLLDENGNLELISQSSLVVNIYDPGRKEVGEFELKVVLQIYSAE